MSKQAVEGYIRHIDHHGTDMVEETVRIDRHLTDEEKAAVLAYLRTKTVPKRKKTKK